MPLDRAAHRKGMQDQAARLAAARAAGGQVDAVSLRLAFARLEPTAQAVLAWTWWGAGPEVVLAKDLLEFEADMAPGKRGALARAARQLGLCWQTAEEHLRRAQLELAALVAALAASEAGLDNDAAAS